MEEQNLTGPESERSPEASEPDLLPEDQARWVEERRRFRGSCYEEAEGPREVCTRLHHLCRRWLRPEQHTKAEMVDLVVLEQFLAILPLEMKKWVRECGPESCSQAVAQAEGFLLSKMEEARWDEERWRFRVASYEEAKGPQEVCNRLYRLCCQWLRPEQHTKVEMLDLVVLEQFLAVLPPEIQNWVWESAPESSSRAVALAERFLLSKDGDTKQVEVWTEGVCDLPEVREGPLDPIRRESLQEGDADVPSNGNANSPPTCDGAEVNAEQPPNQAQVTFEEVAVHFMEEEWALLVPAQRALHQEVTEENCANLAFLDHVQECENHPELSKLSPDRSTKEEEGEILISEDHKGIRRGLDPGMKEIIRVNPKLNKDSQIPGGDECCDDLNLHTKIYTGEKTQEYIKSTKTFGQHSRLVSHHRFDQGEKPHKFKMSGKGFSLSSYLTVHRRNCTGEKPHKCQECGKSFSRLIHLTRHFRSHTGEKPYECKECGKSFSQSINLTTHLRSHTGERPYECQECGRSFSQLTHLATHFRSHTGEKPYECKECGRSFGRSIHLTRHFRSHTGDRPYECQECGRSFSQSTHLTSHLRSHTGEKPYKCEECGKSFSRAAHLTRHCRSHSRERP